LTELSAERAVGATATELPNMPPRWFVRAAWIAHRAVLRLTDGRRGLAVPKANGHFGYLRLATVGRQSGRERAAILGYVEDGSNLVTLAMNGWAAAEPAWWLNLQAQPQATIELKGATRAVRARAAAGEERERLWALVRSHSGWGSDIDRYARRRSGSTAIVVFEPRSA
jgi:deazaflavin-dependent oxidoreductase (nitroreductase family)